MGILNRVINILILLAAIAAVVFSYMLFSKRNELTDGWRKMAEAINATAATLDDKSASGTKAAQELATDKLKHTEYANLDQVLPKLKDNASKIVKQRNDLAKSLQDAANTLEIAGVNAKDFQNVTTYEGKNKDLSGKISAFKSNRDSVFANYVRTGSVAGASITANELKNPAQANAAAQKVNAKINDIKARRDRFSSHIAAVSRTLGVKNPNLAGANYASELNTSLAAVRKVKAEADATKNALAAEKRKTASLNNQIAAHRKTISNHLADIKSKQKRIDELLRVISDDGKSHIPAKLLKSSDPECYGYVKGKIEYIDKDYGFVTINVGKKYEFVQKYGIKDNKVPFPLPVGKIMTIARGLNSDSPEFIGKLLVTKVDDYNAICNLVSGKLSDLRVGDDVYFAAEDIAAATGKADAQKAPAKK